MAIDNAEVRRIAGLAKLELDEATCDTFRLQLQSILDYVSVLGEIDVHAIEATCAGLPGEQRLREDEPRPQLTDEEALANAPDAAAGHFRVPRVLSE